MRASASDVCCALVNGTDETQVLVELMERRSVSKWTETNWFKANAVITHTTLVQAMDSASTKIASTTCGPIGDVKHFEGSKGEEHKVQNGVCVKHGAKTKLCSATLPNGTPCPNQAVAGGVCRKHGAKKKRCSATLPNGTPCLKQAQDGSVCLKHGAKKRRCSATLPNGTPCPKQAREGGVCVEHGAKKRRCSATLPNGTPCPKQAVVGGVCVKHGAKKSRCSATLPNGTPCPNQARGGGVCRKHGAKKKLCSATLPNGTPCRKCVQEGSVCHKHGAKKRRCSATLPNGTPCPKQAVMGGVCVKHGAVVNRCRYNVETQCGIKGNPRYDGACTRCFVHYNPNDPRATAANKYAHVKEANVRDYVKEQFPQINWACDRRVRSAFHDNFALVRPDMRALMRSIGIDTHNLIIEVDEWAHLGPGYTCKGEGARLAAVWRNLGEKLPLIVLRINPDDYVDPGTGKVVRSCFGYSKKRARVDVRPGKQHAWAERLEKLRQRIAYWTTDQNVPEKELSIEELFY